MGTNVETEHELFLTEREVKLVLDALKVRRNRLAHMIEEKPEKCRPSVSAVSQKKREIETLMYEIRCQKRGDYGDDGEADGS